MTKTTDEDGKVTYISSDVIGRTLLEQRMNGTEQLDTYYVYNDFNCLRVVLQPMYQSSGSIDLRWEEPGGFVAPTPMTTRGG